MRIAFVSDIHANLQAWNAAHADIATQSVDKLICLGDIVGYGPSPADVLSQVYANTHYFVLGNHDAVVAGLMPPTGFNPHAKALIDQTCEMLGDKARTFFTKVPLAIKGDGFRCSHANPASPGQFGYILEEAEARTAWERTSDTLSFIGHTHRPRFHVLSEDGTYKRRRPNERPVNLRPGLRYIVNCGSVGMSRDSDPRASYVIYDAGRGTLQWRFVAYDLDAFRHEVELVCDDSELRDFLLKRYDAQKQPPVRELIDFTPGQAAVSESVAEEQELEQIKARVVRWKSAAAVACVLLLMGVIGFWRFWRSLPAPVTLVSENVAAVSLIGDREPVSHQFILGEGCPAGSLPPGWQVALEDSRTQSVQFPAGRVVLSSSDTTAGIELSLPQVETNEAHKVRVNLHGSTSPQFQGEAPTLVIDYRYRDGTERRAAKSEPLVLKEQELSKQDTIEIPKSVTTLRLRVRALFAGEIELDRITLTAIPEQEAEPVATAPVDINRATVKDFCSLPGIGEIRARSIVEYREANGPFRSIEDLLEVKDVGAKTLSGLRGRICVGD